MCSYDPINPKVPFIWHGGDYNPEQWPRETWDEDVQLMRQAQCNVLTLGVFSWVSLQPDEEMFTFEWLDTIMEKLAGAGRFVCLATPTAAQPAWMSQRYPTVLKSDATGRRRHHGGRQNFCPSSPIYRRFAIQIAAKLAERYHAHPSLVAWHISNEYGGLCYCEVCAAAFRSWLQSRYASLDDLNERWWNRFWGHTYTDWSQIEPPYQDGETGQHALNLDYLRFQNDIFLACFTGERDAIRQFSSAAVTTNSMSPFWDIDFRTWAREMDVISWDNYPAPDAHPSAVAFRHDLHRGLRDGQPFLLMEQTPSSQNWQPINALQRPGQLRLRSYQAIAHGAESAMYFQWRRSRGGSEKFHGAVVEHSRRADARVFREVAALGAELTSLGNRTLGGMTPARIGIFFDWESWWALESSIGPVVNKRYVETVRQHYAAFWRRNVAVDIVYKDTDLNGYSLVIAPMLYMVMPPLASRIEDFVSRGGTFLATYLSGVADANDLVYEGYPGPLRSLLGIRSEEIDALMPDQSNQLVMVETGKSYRCARLCDLIHSEIAEVLATYGADFYAGRPALTRNTFGNGTAYYLAAEVEDAGLDDLYDGLLAQLQIQPAITTPADVEATLHTNDQGPLLYLLNHRAESVTVTLPDGKIFTDLLTNIGVSGTLTLPAYGVAILGEG
jgi:beta-galactosidase